MKPYEKQVAKRKRKKGQKSKKNKAKKKPQKQHIIDEEVDLNDSKIMTEGWGGTKAVSPQDAEKQQIKNMGELGNFYQKQRRVDQITERLYGHNKPIGVRRMNAMDGQRSARKNRKIQQRKEWIGSNNTSIESSF
jgi:hypothetical protein